MNTPETIDASKVIDLLGGTAEAARLCDVSDSAVSQWRNKGIPKDKLRIIRLERPDLFAMATKTNKHSRRATDKGAR